MGADGDNLLRAITHAEERTEPDPQPRDLPAAAAQPEQPAVAAADQPVVPHDGEEGGRCSRGDDKADHPGSGAVAPACALAGQRLIRLVHASEALGRGRVIGMQIGVRLHDRLPVGALDLLPRGLRRNPERCSGR
jgi:hypothetical protein